MSRHPATLAVRLLLGVALIALAAPAVAQRSYKADDVDKSLASKGAIVRNYLTKGIGDEQEFRAYFTKYYFPEMTRPEPKALAILGKMSGDLFKNYLYKAKGPQQEWLSNEALKWCGNVLRSRQYHPAVRLNALLVLGKIDDEYSNESPTPSAQANKMLCSLAQKAATDGRRPRYELTGALTGLQRHARFFKNLPNDQKRQTMKTLNGVLAARKLAGEYNAGVRDWAYLQAGDAVASLGNAGFAKAIGIRMLDPSLALETRAELASKLDAMKTNAAAAPAAALAKAVLKLANEVAEQEALVATAFEELGGRRRGTTVDRDLIERRITEGESRQYQLRREGIVDLLVDLRTGVQAVNRLSGEGGQADLKRVDDALGDVLQLMEDKNTVDLKITDAIKRAATKIAAAAAEDPGVAVAN